MTPHCVCCGSQQTVLIGSIPSATVFAGRRLKNPLNGGKLFRCQFCGLAFRYPCLEKSELDALYLLGDSENWQGSANLRTDWSVASHWLGENLKTGGSILDVGCFDGGFLQSNKAGYELFGVEIHEAAADKARSRGVHVIANDFASLANSRDLFDAVVSFDVIEHAHNPMMFLSNLAGVTRQNGLVIISTGNSDSYSWKLSGSNYWYCVIGEHLSFVNPTWCAWAAPKLGLELLKLSKFSHSNATWWKRQSDLMRNLAFAFLPSLYIGLRKLGLYRGDLENIGAPPYWGSAKDHCIYLFRKK